MILRKLQAMAVGLIFFGHVGMLEAVSADITASLTKQLQAAVPDMRIQQIRESALPGIYEVQTASREIIYVSADGQFVFVGDLLHLQGDDIRNLTEDTRTKERARLLAKVPEKELISFVPATEVKRLIYVFTDIDCGYCRKLHQDIPALNAMGIQVSYLSFPRSEPGSPSFQKAVHTWCAKDRLQAITDAKSGKAIAENNCVDNPVEAHYRLGEKLGVNGTPAIFAGDGQAIRGYLPPDKLAKALGLK